MHQHTVEWEKHNLWRFYNLPQMCGFSLSPAMTDNGLNRVHIYALRSDLLHLLSIYCATK